MKNAEPAILLPYRTAWILCTVLALNAVLAGAAFAQQDRSVRRQANKAQDRARKMQDRELAVLRTLRQPVKKVNFDEEPLEEVIAWFREAGLKNIVVTWKTMERAADIGRETPITLQLECVPLGAVLDLVLEQVSSDALLEEDELTYHVFNGMLQISTRGNFNRKIHTRAYYVEDLLYPVTLNALAPSLSIGQQFAYVRELEPFIASGAVAIRPEIDVIDTGSQFGPGYSYDERPDFRSIRENAVTELVGLLKTIRPLTWQENGGRGSIHPFGEKLVINQTIEMHEIIGGTFRQIGSLQEQARKNKP